MFLGFNICAISCHMRNLKKLSGKSSFAHEMIGSFSWRITWPFGHETFILGMIESDDVVSGTLKKQRSHGSVSLPGMI